MRAQVAALALGIATISAVHGQQPRSDHRTEQMLRQLFPQAAAYSARRGTPPHYEAYAAVTANAPPIGIGVWTTDLDPLERGYDGPIKILVGLDMRGLLAGVVVADHHEPYGYFSVDLPAFAAQFKGKSVRDPFIVGRDVDAISRATLTMTSAARAIRNSARRAASALIPPSR
jgi:NosR/NirI family transcriptional regulator, nitrous oxide reductase regulator